MFGQTITTQKVILEHVKSVRLPSGTSSIQMYDHPVPQRDRGTEIFKGKRTEV